MISQQPSSSLKRSGRGPAKVEKPSKYRLELAFEIAASASSKWRPTQKKSKNFIQRSRKTTISFPSAGWWKFGEYHDPVTLAAQAARVKMSADMETRAAAQQFLSNELATNQQTSSLPHERKDILGSNTGKFDPFAVLRRLRECQLATAEPQSLPIEDEYEEPLSEGSDLMGSRVDLGDTQSTDDTQGDSYAACHSETWMDRFRELVAYRNQFGNCLVPNTYSENLPLAQWVKRQRYQYKLRLEGHHSTMTDDRIALLQQVGFVWNSHGNAWEEQLQSLLDFRARHGHCNVPSRYEGCRKLAVWVKRQRRQYKFLQGGKPSSMTPERIAILERLGFEWDLKSKNF